MDLKAIRERLDRWRDCIASIRAQERAGTPVSAPGGMFADAAEHATALLAELDIALAELRRLEWSVFGNAGPRCPTCDNYQYSGHAPDCTLAAILARANPA